MTSTPIFDALAADLLTESTSSDETAEAQNQPDDHEVRLNGHLG
ncbi:hypothetical protein ACSHWB_36775 [Lentzea sp. HUAS TT2]